MSPQIDTRTYVGINILFDSEGEFALPEIVGHGFGVTDLNRGEITPHECIRLEIRDEQVTSRVVHRQVTDDLRHSETVKVRLRKVGRDTIAKQLTKSESYSEIQLEVIGRQYLESRGSMLLLESGKRYRPLPANHLERVVSNIKDLPWHMQEFGSEKLYVISCSALGPEAVSRVVFWDIVRPSQRYSLLTAQ